MHCCHPSPGAWPDRFVLFRANNEHPELFTGTGTGKGIVGDKGFKGQDGAPGAMGMGGAGGPAGNDGASGTPGAIGLPGDKGQWEIMDLWRKFRYFA